MKWFNPVVSASNNLTWPYLTDSRDKILHNSDYVIDYNKMAKSYFGELITSAQSIGYQRMLKNMNHGYLIIGFKYIYKFPINK